jgi:Rieske Fe-S protein
MSRPSQERRSVLIRLVQAGGALITAGLAGLAGVVAMPRNIAATTRWKKAASMFDLSPTAPLNVVITERHADGWYETKQQTVLFIDKDASGYRALSAICSHLGCHVKWDAAGNHFRCPCHGGIYDRTGKVVSGPPPRPLDQLRVRVNAETSDIEVEL